MGEYRKVSGIDLVAKNENVNNKNKNIAHMETVLISAAAKRNESIKGLAVLEEMHFACRLFLTGVID